MTPSLPRQTGEGSSFTTGKQLGFQIARSEPEYRSAFEAVGSFELVDVTLEELGEPAVRAGDGGEDAKVPVRVCGEPAGGPAKLADLEQLTLALGALE